MCFARIAEDVFPFVYYLKNASRLKARSELPALLQDEAFRGYDRLPVDELDRRLAEEHERAVVLDDKTLKVTLFLSAGFSILGLGLTVIRGVPPKLIIFNGFLVGAGAQHCQGQIRQRDRFATTMTIPTRNGDFGVTRAGSEWPARRAHSTACPNA